MFRLVKQVFTALLASMVNASNFTTYISLNNQPCMTRPTLIGLITDEHNQGLHYYQFLVNLDKRKGNYNSLDDPSNKICVPNETEDINLRVFYMITRINESKSLTKHIL